MKLEKSVRERMDKLVNFFKKYNIPYYISKKHKVVILTQSHVGLLAIGLNVNQQMEITLESRKKPYRVFSVRSENNKLVIDSLGDSIVLENVHVDILFCPFTTTMRPPKVVGYTIAFNF